MRYISSTYKILYYRAIGYSVSKEWIDWPVDMIVAGFETEHLLYLVNVDIPDNAFKLWDIADRLSKN